MNMHNTQAAHLANAPFGRWRSYGYLMLSMTLVGSYVALSRPLTAALPVFLLAWLRFGIGGVAMVHWLTGNDGGTVLPRSTRRLLWILSLFGNFLFTICMLLGVRMTSAVSAGVIMASIPAVVAMMSWLFLGERISKRVGAAIVCAVAGIALLAFYKEPHAGLPLGAVPQPGWSSAWLGNTLVFGAVVCEAIYAVLAKRISASVSARRVAATINRNGFLLVTPLGIYSAWQFDFHAVSAGVWALLVFYALAASVWSVWLWMTGLQGTDAAHAGVFTVMLPVSATLTGVLFLGEHVASTQMEALALAMLGVLLATLPPRAPAPPQQASVG